MKDNSDNQLIINDNKNKITMDTDSLHLSLHSIFYYMQREYVTTWPVLMWNIIGAGIMSCERTTIITSTINKSFLPTFVQPKLHIEESTTVIWVSSEG